jgi:hypothetical protein
LNADPLNGAEERFALLFPSLERIGVCPLTCSNADVVVFRSTSARCTRSVGVHIAATGEFALEPPRIQNATADISGVAGAWSDGHNAVDMPKGIDAEEPTD